MKKYYLFLLLCYCSVISFQSHAQTAASYTFSQTTGTYTPLSSPNGIFTSTWDDDVSNGWLIGFPFTYCGTSYTSFSICANGWITFSTLSSGTTTPLSSFAKALSPLSADLYYSPSGTITYLTTGSSPNRVCTIQWLNCCHYSSSTTGPLNFQIKLHETSNVIEFCYGACTPSSSSSYSVQVGITGNSTSDYNDRSATGSWASTTAGTSNSATCTQSDVIVPSNGLIFRWSPPCTSVPAIAGPSIVCPGANITLSDAGSGGTWSSGNPTLATVNSSGVVTGVSMGNATISYTTSACSAIKTVSVNTPPVITATATPSVICSGGTSSLNASATNPGGGYALSSITYAPVSFTAAGTFNSGTTPTSGSNDDGYYTVTMPFSFTLYGTPYTTCYVGVNGYVCFGSGMTTTYINTIPNTSFPATISIFGRDLNLGVGGSITYGVTGTAPNRVFIISYNSVPDYSSGGLETGEILMYETSNNVELHVTTAQATTHSMGIQSNLGTSSVPVTGQNNTSTAVTNTAWAIGMVNPSFSWAADPTLSSTTIVNPVTSPLSATHVYTAIATASNGCSASSTVTVTISAPPVALTGTAVLCQAGTTTLSSTAGGTWASSNTGIATVASVTSGVGIVTGVSSGTATISYAFGSSCYVVRTVTVLPTAPITGPSIVCPGLTINLSDAMTGGTWTSSNTSLATVNPATGDVTGIATGTLTISYTLPNGCPRGLSMTVNPLPAVITGPVAVCKGLSITLTETSTGGTWSSSNSASATVDPVSATTGSVTGVLPGAVVITYTLPNTCTRTASVVVNPLPDPIGVPAAGACITNANNAPLVLTESTTPGAWSSGSTAVATINSSTGALTGLTAGTTTITYTLPTSCIITAPVTINPLPAAISGTPVVCQGGVTYLNDFTFGGTWSSSNTAWATVTASTGIVTGTGAGNPVITYTSGVGCRVTTTVTVNAIPAAITGSTQVCAGNTTALSDITAGGTWISSNTGYATVTSAGGVVSSVAPGNLFITYTLPSTGCFATTGLTVNPTPAAITAARFDVCYGTTLTLNDASAGGAWSTASPAVTVIGGVVTPTASNTIPVTAVINYGYPGTGCNATQTVTIDPLPAVYALTAAKASYCANDLAGVDLTLLNSTAGTVRYSLYNGSTLEGSQDGTGSPLLFAGNTAAGTYYVVATDKTGIGCTATMTGTPTISIDPLPLSHHLSTAGSSTYCAGTSGVDVTLDGSESTNNYFLKNTVSGYTLPAVAGIDAPLDFGVLPGDSTYIAYATSAAGCSSSMTGVVTINKNNLPDVHNVIVSDSGYYCAGGTGVHLGMDYSNSGVSYSLYKGGILVKKLAGSNAALDFGGNNLAGTYTVVAENALCAQNMNGSIPVAARPLPGTGYPVTPASAGYCAGGTGPEVMMTSSQPGNISYQLMLGATPVGVPHTATTPGGSVDFGAQTTGGTYTIVATDNTYVATHCSATLAGNAVITAYPALHADTVTLSDNGQFCAGGTGVHVYLNSSVAGVYYQVFKVGGVAPILLGQTGTGGTIDFGMDTSAGAVTVLAMGSSSMGNCTAYMSGTPVVTVNTLPAANNVTVDNGGYYCDGGTGVKIGLSFSDAGVSYQLYKGGVATGSALTGASSSLNFGTFTDAATYTVTGTNTTTGCAGKMTGSAVVTINPKPVAYNITGGGSYCTGTTTGVPVGLFKSEVGVSYQLYNGTSAMGAAIAGTGAALNFGNNTAAGLYTVAAANTTTGCAGNMTGSTVITIDPLPVAYDVTGGGSYCTGGAGLPIGLSNSVAGVNYQLLNSGVPVGAAMAGTTGSAINFGVKTAAGNYTVVANTAISGCTNSMTGSKVITVNALPAIDTVKGGGGYCAGDAGADIYMAHTRPGVNYMLYHGSAPVGIAVLGDGTNADLGLQGAAGSYTVIAADAATGCTSNMAGTVTVFTNPAPAAYTVFGSGTICAGATGIHVYLSGSQVDKSYSLYNGSDSSLRLIAGTGSALDFGAQTGNGAYTVVASDRTTGCMNNMNGAGNILVNPAPASFAVTDGGHYCQGGPGVFIGLAGSEGGVNYQLYKSSVATDMPVGGTGTTITFSRQTDADSIYTIRATNTTTLCSSNMTGSVAVIIDTIGTPAVSIDRSVPVACVGNAITYTAKPVIGGSMPTYVWKVNGVLVGIDSTYRNIPAEGDIVSVAMTSNANCVTSTKASSSVTMSLVPYSTPAATVAVTPGTDVCRGTTVSLKATTIYGGDRPGYFWMRNGVFADSGTSYTYTPNSGNDKDVITFMLHSNYACSTNDTVFSDPVVMIVDSAVVPVFSVTATWGPLKDAVGVGQIDTFIATIGKGYEGWHYTYQWYVQGTPVPGATEPVYIDHTTYNNDVVSCQVTKTGACGSQTATEKTTVLLKNLGTQVLTTIGEVSVIPNPNKGEFTVKGTVAGKDGEVTLEVTNMLGQSVYVSKVMTHGGAINEHIKLGNTLASGMYLLTLRSGTATNVFHMVIEQ